MEELIKAIIYILTGVAILLAGMKYMSSGLKKCVGPGIKKFFKKTQNNPAVSMGIGTVVTIGIQSSDATNSMVVGFINAGAMTIFQGLCIMLGAYIGTTITGVLASFSSLSISVYFLLFSFIGILMTFMGKDKIRNIGEILAGFGLLFFGLAVMKENFQNDQIKNFCTNLFTSVDLGIVLFIVGVLITAVVQSSSAVISIVIAMVGASSLNLESGLYIALGATLGTVANTLLSSLGGNIQGKRAAIAIFFLRIISSAICLTILMIFEKPICEFLHIFRLNGSDELPVAMFTVIYNVIFMPLLLPLLKPMIDIVTKIVKDKDHAALESSVHFIDDKLLNSPAIAIMQAEKEIINMFDIAYSNYLLGINLLISKDKTHNDEIIKKEDQCDYLNKRITDFIIKLSTKVDSANSNLVGGFFHVINDIERIGDHAYNFYEMFVSMEQKDLSFSKEAIKDISDFNNVLKDMFELTKKVFISKETSELEPLHELENKTDIMSKEMSTGHYNRITQNKCDNSLTPFYSSLITEMERIADHLTNIGYSIVNPLGDDE